MSDMVTVGSYLDPMDVQFARLHLEEHGIRAAVVETSNFDPTLIGVSGGIRLQVAEKDELQARTLLRALANERTEIDPDADAGEVRCPRCELAYCFFEPPSLRGVAPGATELGVFVAAILRFGPKRWTCHKCGHRWDDPNEGPKRPTVLKPGDPRPVFRLKRSAPGMGAFMGFMVGAGFVLASGFAPILVLPAAALLGYLIGNSLNRDVCSEPSCRKQLPAHAETCEGCGGFVAGEIRRAAEHFAEAAEARREIVRMRKARKTARRKRAEASGG